MIPLSLLRIISFFSVLCLCLLISGFAVAAQDPSDDRVHVIGPGFCQDNEVTLDVIAQNTPADGLLIVIARLGQKEARAGLNRRRLHNVRTFWTEFRNKRKPETIILAEGERVKDHGRLEVYVGGKLAVILKLKRDVDLIVGNCYPDPLEAPFCSVKSNRNFYPCLDRNQSRKGR